MRYSFLILCCLLPRLALGQSEDPVRLLPFLHGFVVAPAPPVTEAARFGNIAVLMPRQAVRPALLLNIRGIEIAVETLPGDLGKASLYKAFPRFGLRRRDAMAAGTIAGLPCRFLRKTVAGGPATGMRAFYFLPGADGTIDGYSFTGYDSIPESMVAGTIALVRGRSIPDSPLSAEGDDLFRLADRRVSIGRICRWMGTTIVQCPDNGELNWSLHPAASEAARQLALQRASNMSGRFETLDERTQDILFADVPVAATRVQYRLKGARGVLAQRVEGSRDLIVYYVNAPVRGVHVACVLSYWTSDRLVPESGLPPLLHEVMRLR